MVDFLRKQMLLLTDVRNAAVKEEMRRLLQSLLDCGRAVTSCTMPAVRGEDGHEVVTIEGLKGWRSPPYPEEFYR